MDQSAADSAVSAAPGTAAPRAPVGAGNLYLFVFWVVCLAGYIAANVVVLTLAIVMSTESSEKKQRLSKIMYIVALFMLVILVGVLAAVSAWNTK